LFHIIKWFAANNLVPNLDETNIMKFISKNLSHATLYIGYRRVYRRGVNTKYLGVQIDNHPNWMNSTEQMIPKLSGAYYAVRSVVHISNINTLKSIYSAYFHFVIKYGIIFGGCSSSSGEIFTLQIYQNYG
jgi:hypothetical protein